MKIIIIKPRSHNLDSTTKTFATGAYIEYNPNSVNTHLYIIKANPFFDIIEKFSPRDFIDNISNI